MLLIVLRWLAGTAAGCAGAAFLGAAGAYNALAASTLELVVWGCGLSAVAVLAALALRRVDPPAKRPRS